MHSVNDYIATDVPTVDSSATIQETAVLMMNMKSGSIFIKDGDNFVGVVTDSDFTRKVASEGRPVSEKISAIMSSPIYKMDRSVSMMEAHEFMLSSQIRHLAISENGKIIGFLSITDFLKYHQRVKEQLKSMSLNDGLTEIYNRRYFNEMIVREWKRGAREKTPLSLIMLDIDYFKMFNDTYGHQKGDECLKKIAACIKNTLQRPADFVARYGGEEFVIVLPNLDSTGAYKLAKKIRSDIENLKIEHKKNSASSFATVSLGVANCTPQPGNSYESLIINADKSLYQSKGAGRNQVKLHGE